MTAMNRISSLSLLNGTIRDATSLQQQLGELQEQISSGVKASSFSGLNGQVEQYTLLESKIRRADQLSESNQIAITKLQTADKALDSLTDVGSNMQQLIMTQLNSPTGSTLSFSQQMKNALESFAQSLNMQFDGRYIFSGTATLTPPVQDTTIPPAVDGVPDANYYEGAQTSQTMRADENITYDFPVRADDPAFQKIYAAAHQAIRAYESGDVEKLGAALDLMNSGMTDLNSARSRVNSAVVNVGNINDRLDTMSLYWKGITEKVGKTDLVAASTQVASYESVLQATFQVYARLSQLRLSDYLK